MTKSALLVVLAVAGTLPGSKVLAQSDVGVVEPQGAVVVACGNFRYVIGADGSNVALVGTATGQNYCQPQPVSTVARALVAGQWRRAIRASGDQHHITVGFDDTPATAVLRFTSHAGHVVLEVLNASDEIDELQLVNMPLTLRGSLDEPFAACLLALNLQTNVTAIPGPSSRLMASCVRRFGLAGAVVAIIACPTERMRDVLKEAVSASESLPQSPVGGPWAMDAPINRASYLFAVPTEENVEQIIQTVKSIGFNQVQIHGGRHTYRFGDCLPNPQVYPRGVESLRAVIRRLHDEGIYVGMHPYAFFIDKATPWVTPVPAPGLASSAVFTLAEDLSADADVVPVLESTAQVSTVTGFFERNSVTLRIGDELLTFGDRSEQPPYAFTRCTRGALGTTASAHAVGAPVHHLKECFGLFVPDPDAPLFSEVVEANARFFNECGFDSIYQDALDGEDILGGRENSWHYGTKFVWELWKRLERPAAIEYSTFHHHLWVLRSRHGAWDHPNRAHKRFIDQHVIANRQIDRMFLPSNLGWWAFKTWQPPSGEPTFPDDIEYWCIKALGTDSGLSLMGYDPALPGHQRLAAIVRRYEQLRHAGAFAEEIKAQLREPGAEFSLEQVGEDRWQFRPVHSSRHKVHGVGDWSRRWTISNPHEPQAPTVRIESLMAAGAYEADGNITLARFDSPDEFPERASAPAVTASLQPVTEAGETYGRLTATNKGSDRRGTWASFQKTFDPPLDLRAHQGVGVWVRGDGKGQVLNFQLQSPHHITRARGEYYVVVDFEGWRYFELIEPDAERFTDYAWPYYGGYHVYRESFQPAAVQSLTIWCNHLPTEDSITVDVRPVRALPLLSARVVNPRLTVGASTIEFPVEIPSGNYVEVSPAGEVRRYGPAGELLEQLPLGSALPQLVQGDNRIEFTCQGAESPPSRGQVQIRVLGEPIQ